MFIFTVESLQRIFLYYKWGYGKILIYWINWIFP